MKITISYDSKYSLGTTRNEEILLTSMGAITADEVKSAKGFFKKENSYFENMKALNQAYPNFIYADITKNTVLGVLCRLIGEVRRLDDLEDSHPILSLKDKITFENTNTDFQNELITLHNQSNLVKDNGGALISTDCNHFLLDKNPLSETLLSIFLIRSQEEAVDVLTRMENNDESLFYSRYPGQITVRTFLNEYLTLEKSEEKKELHSDFSFISNKWEIREYNKKLYSGSKQVMQEFFSYLNNAEGIIAKPVVPKGVTVIQNLWGFIFAEKINFLRRNGLFLKEFSTSLNASGTCLRGVAPASGGFTIREYFLSFVDDKKISWTMPYTVELKYPFFDEDSIADYNFKAKVGVTKECGKLEINLDIPKEEALALHKRIDNAGVNTFHLGKKGLAYIEKIELER